MKTRLMVAFGSLALLAALAETSRATSLEFNGAAGANNQPIPTNYGSGIVVNTDEFITDDGSGTTPNIGLTWSGAPSLWEYHTAGTFDPIEAQIDTGTTNAVAQLQTGPNSISFSAPPGIQFELNSFVIGNATDQNEDSYGFDITLVRDFDDVTVFTHFTPFFPAGDVETVFVDYLGDPGEDYTLNFIRAPDDGGITYRSAIDNLSFSETVAPGAAAFKLVVNRDSGDITLKNFGTGAGSIKGYSLESAFGALDPDEWLSIADNYDAGSPGPNQIDADDNWTVQSAIHTDLSEAELEGGDGASLAGNSSVLLGSGAWLQNPLESDLQIELTLPGGDTQAVAIEYEGNGGIPYEYGDFDFDGDIDAADWLIHNAGRGTDLTGLSSAQGYHRGDIDGSGEIDIVDFVLFKERFEEANGAGSFGAMAGVPEPSAVMLFLAGALFLGIGSSWRCRARFLAGGGASVNSFRLCGALLVMVCLAGMGRATTVDFTGAASGSNADIPLDYGSNIAADSTGFVTTDGTGATPNIALTWSPSPNTWEYHTGNFWDTLGTPVHVAQLDGLVAIGDPTILFDASPDATWTLNSLDIGHASDQSEPDFSWNINVVRVSDDATVFTHTTAALGPSDTESVDFSFAGDLGEDYRLVFDDGGMPGMADTRRAAIDNLSFSEVTLAPLSLRINRNDGEIFVENTSGIGIAIDSYEITSLSGSLDPVGWNSLEVQDFEGNGPPGTGNGWEEAGGVSPNQLIESYLLGDSLIPDGASISLGHAFDFDNVNVQEDILFAYHFADGPAINTMGTVSFFGAVQDADFDDDGDVDGDDFLTWQASFGLNAGGDADGDGDTDGDDFLIWQGSFGSAGGNAAGTSVPEPSTVVLFFSVAAAYLCGRRCRNAAEAKC